MRFWLPWLISAVAACSGAGEPSAGPWAATATSKAVAFVLQATTPDGAPPARGLDNFELRVENAADGTPAEHLSLRVEPWMPAMGHGAPPVDGVAEQGAGNYLVPNVSLYMPGRWELRTTIGPMDDEATVAFDVQ